MERRDEEDDEERQQSAASDRLIRRIATPIDGGSAVHVDPIVWPTVDGPLGLGLSDEKCVDYARRFFRWGFLLLPFLWAVNCFYFWPVLRYRDNSSFQRIRPYVVASAISFVVFTVLLSSWALTFAIGGESLFGPVWNDLLMYNIADKLGLTDWM